jgi:hypothetical protein
MSEEAGWDDGLVARVRPYALTGGRTRGTKQLALETLVRTTPEGRAALPRLQMEPRRVLELCADLQSIAEVSAHLSVPLGVARVIVGDLTGDGLLAASDDPNPNSDRPDIKLLERVLDGLQAL